MVFNLPFTCVFPPFPCVCEPTLGVPFYPIWGGSLGIQLTGERMAKFPARKYIFYKITGAVVTEI